MAIKRYKPTSAARRFMTVHTYEEITETKPERSLIEDMRKTGGRNNQGKITVPTSAAATAENTASSTSSAIRTAFPQRSKVFSMTPTAAQTSHCSRMPTAKRDTSLRPSA